MIDNLYLANLLEKEFNNNSLGKKFLIFADEGDMVKATKYGNYVLSFTHGLLETITSQITPIKNLRFQNWNMQLMLLCDLAKTGFVEQGDYNRLQSDNLIDIKQCIMEVFERLNGQTISIADDNKTYSMTFALSLPTVGEKMSLGEISEGMPIYLEISMTLFENGVNSGDYNVIVDGEDMYFTNAVLSRVKVTEQNPNMFGNNTKASVMNNGLGMDLVIPQISSPVCNKIEDEILDGTDRAYCVILQRGEKRIPYICTNLKGQQSIALTQNIGINISFAEAVEDCLEFEENKWIKIIQNIKNENEEKTINNLSNSEIAVFWGDGKKEIIEKYGSATHIYKEPKNYEMYVYNSTAKNKDWINFQITDGLIFTGLDINGNITTNDELTVAYMVGNGEANSNGYVGESEIVYIPSLYKNKPVIKISKLAFKGNSTITNVYFPSTIVEIGENAFYGCVNLKQISISQNIKKIDNNAFAFCSNLTSVEIPSTIQELGSGIFNYCISLKTVILENGLSKIPTECFMNCSNLQFIIIPESVKNIEKSAFSFSGLVSVEIPESVELIETGAFLNCESLKEVTIAGNTTIGATVFFRCYNLTKLTLLAIFPPSLLDANAISTSTEVIYVPAESLETYKIADVWSNFADIIVGK